MVKDQHTFLLFSGRREARHARIRCRVGPTVDSDDSYGQRLCLNPT